MRKERRRRIFTIARIEYFIVGEEKKEKDRRKNPANISEIFRVCVARYRPRISHFRFAWSAIIVRIVSMSQDYLYVMIIIYW